MNKTPPASVLSLAELPQQQSPEPAPCLVEPGLLPAQGILFVGGEPRVGKSLLVTNLALAWRRARTASGSLSPGRAACWSASSSYRCRSSSAGWRPCANTWAPLPTATCSSIPAPAAVRTC